MSQSWEQIIQGNWFSISRGSEVSGRVWLVLASFVISAFSLRSGTPAQQHKSKTARKTSAASAKAETPKAVGAAGLIAIAQHQLDGRNFAAAVSYSIEAGNKTPKLNDYAQYIHAQAAYELKNYADVAQAATAVFNQAPPSPLIGAAASLVVRAGLDGDRPKQALELTKKYYQQIPQPEADLLLARSLDATGDLPQAAEYYQRVYYGYPVAKEATDAANALVSLKQRLGDAYPPVMPDAMIARAQKLFDLKNPGAARIELTAAIPQLGGVQRDLARVRLGVADLLSGKPQEASEYLSALKVDDPEADAERLNYLIRCARKMDRQADVKPLLQQLEEQHGESRWRMDSLIFVADQARTDNDSATYVPLYRACAFTFPKDPRSAWCHWQVAFDSYRHDGKDTYDLLRAHLQQYPGSENINNALYFFGRFQERRNENASARACYDELIRRFPNTYYAVVARDRLKQPSLEAATPDPEMATFLHSVNWPAQPQFPSFTPSELAQSRLDRSTLLQVAGLNDFAENELKFGARNDGTQVNVYAYHLALLAAAQNAPDRALHYVKTYAPGYLFMPLDQAPVDFWKLAFPIPYRAFITEYSNDQSLDPFLVAALIRQESEFDAGVRSHANAYGLMQLLPTTGTQLARHFGIKRLSASQLFVPARNVQLGTYFFHNLLNSYGGQTEIALASYNAGPGRANLWRTWGPFREPAEFIETVPFHETRGYVQIVLRNADVYRRLYSGTVPDVPVYKPKPPPKVKSKKHVKRHK